MLRASAHRHMPLYARSTHTLYMVVHGQGSCIYIQSFIDQLCCVLLYLGHVQHVLLHVHLKLKIQIRCMSLAPAIHEVNTCICRRQTWYLWVAVWVISRFINALKI